MPSQVIALKYRPKNLKELIGQEIVASSLSRALSNNKLAHAYLFSGLRGSGKTSTARIFAKSMLCELENTSDPCGVCKNCMEADRHKHPDIIELDAASHRGIDDIRDIIENAKYSPSIGRFKVFIIDEAHMITTQAFNAFLKTLEEPIETTKFILATTDPMKIPSTILSRTQHYRFKKISRSDMVLRMEHILNQENVKFEESALQLLARNAQGSMRDALTLLDQAIAYGANNVNENFVIEMLGLLDRAKIDEIFKYVFAKDIESLKNIIIELESYELENIIDEFVFYLQDKLFNNDDKFNTTIIDRFFRILNDAKKMIFIHSSSIFTLTLMMFKFVESMQIKDIDSLIKELEEQSEKIQPQAQIQQPKKEEELIKQEPQSKPKKDDRFDKLIATFQDRNPQFAECFANRFSIKSIQNNVLTMIDNKNSDLQCDKLIKIAGATIRNLIYEIYGEDTKIQFEFEEKNEDTKNQETNTQQITTQTNTDEMNIDEMNIEYEDNNDIQEAYKSSTSNPQIKEEDTDIQISNTHKLQEDKINKTEDKNAMQIANDLFT